MEKSSRKKINGRGRLEALKAVHSTSAGGCAEKKRKVCERVKKRCD